MVDGISLHNYFGNEPELTGGKSERFLAQNLDMERQIQRNHRGRRLRAGPLALAEAAVAVVRRMERLVSRARRPEHLDGKGTFAPKLLEEVYNLEDAMLTGGFLNTLMRQSDRVRVACLAQIVNVIAPLVTNSKGTLRQSIYFPYQMALKYARGRMLDIQVESETYPITRRGPACRLRARRGSAVPRRGRDLRCEGQAHRRVRAQSRLCRTNASSRSTFDDITPSSVLACETVTGPDLKAFNTFESPNKVVATKLDAARPARR